MINSKTVLVLGAGASMPYGLPSGDQLYDLVCDSTNSDLIMFSQMGFPAERLKKFTREMRYSGCTTVDEFLENRKEFAEIGKMLIAFCLIPYEQNYKLFENNFSNWYKYLFKRMKSKNASDLVNNNLTILTFNYDRSLEHFLFTSIKNSYGLTDAEAAVIMLDIKIIYLHGSLGFLPHKKNNDTRQYESTINGYKISIAYKNIRLMSDDITVEIYDEAFKELCEAENIFFLGWGYHDFLIERLRLKDITPAKKRIAGTSLGIGAANKQLIRQNSNNVINNLNDCDISTFFKEHYPLG